MATRKIREYGDEILKKQSKEVEKIDEKIKQLVEDMIETMHKNNGYGLAAPQVGVLKRIVVIDLYDKDTLFVLINPIIEKEEGTQVVEEGCLSFPNQFAKLNRPKKVIVKALDENGKEFTLTGEGLLAQAICHEIDHLNGELFIEKMIPGTFEVINPKEE